MCTQSAHVNWDLHFNLLTDLKDSSIGINIIVIGAILNEKHLVHNCKTAAT